MKAKLTEWIKSLSGSMSKDFYAVPCPNQPGWCIIRRKPGPRKPNNRRPWAMPDGQAKAVSAFTSNQAKASAIYRNPELRAQYEKEYFDWLRQQARYGKPGNVFHGKTVRWLWDYIRIRVAEDPSPIAPPPNEIS